MIFETKYQVELPRFPADSCRAAACDSCPCWSGPSVMPLSLSLPGLAGNLSPISNSNNLIVSCRDKRVEMISWEGWQKGKRFEPKSGPFKSEEMLNLVVHKWSPRAPEAETRGQSVKSSSLHRKFDTSQALPQNSKNKSQGRNEVAADSSHPKDNLRVWNRWKERLIKDVHSWLECAHLQF